MKALLALSAALSLASQGAGDAPDGADPRSSHVRMYRAPAAEELLVIRTADRVETFRVHPLERANF